MPLPTIESLETRRVYSASATTVREMLGERASLNDANYLGSFNTRASRSASTWLGGDDGYQALYQVNVNAPIMLTAKLSNLRQRVLTQLLFSDGTPITYATNSSSKTELITQRLDPGTYYLDLMTNSDTPSRIKISVKSAKAPFGSVAPQPPDDILDVKSGFTLDVPFSANPTPSTSTPDYVGAIPDGITPNPNEDLHYQGGYTMQDLNFANLYVGGYDWSSSDMQNIDSALSAAMSDPTLNSVMQQYYSGPITSNFLGSAALPGYAPTSVSADDVNAYLSALDKAGYLSNFNLHNTVFNLMLPSGTVLTDGSANSLNGLGGFHSSVHTVNAQGQSDTIYFAVGVYGENLPSGYANGIPVFDQSWKNVAGAFYHELNEARTDPDVEDASRYNDASYLGWVSDTGNEVGDFPVSETDSAGLPLTTVFCEVPLSDASGTVPIQLMWSNQAHAPVDPTGHALQTYSPDDGSDWYFNFD